MDVTVALDIRYFVTPDGAAWSVGGMAFEFFARYLAAFDRVRVVARATAVEIPPPGSVLVTGDRVVFCPIPDYQGPWQYVARWVDIQRAVQEAVPVRGAVILRVSSQIGNCVEWYLRKRKYPYALEVIGDPYEVCAPGALAHPLRPLLRLWFPRQLRRQCRQACAVAYVTQKVLQQRYPPRNLNTGVADVALPEEASVPLPYATSYSNVDLRDEAVAGQGPRIRTSPPYTIVTVGSLAQMYKGTDVLISATAQCVRAGLDVKVIIVGEGQYRPTLMALADQLNLGSRCSFTGLVPAGAPIRKILDSADLFVLPSRTEGLPRALIEAMARALPCIGSRVGGVPELLDDDDLVPAGDASALTAKISEVLGNPARRAKMSVQNLQASSAYRDSVLHLRRKAFYEYVRNYTENWERQHST